jgi:membrane protease YdiL (CAAX protease family)
MKTVFKYYLLYIGLSLLGAFIMLIPTALVYYAVTSHLHGYFHNPWCFSAIMLGSQLLPLYVFRRRGYADYSIDNRLNSMKLYLWLAVATIGCILLASVVLEFIPFDEMEDLESLEQMGTNPIGIIAGCILAPLVEETFFRGIIERHLLETRRNPWFAILFSAILFSVSHFNLTQGIFTLIAGILLGWVYYRTRNLWPCIFIHAFNNTVSTLSGFIYDDTTIADESFTIPMDFAVLATGVALLYFSIRQIHKFIRYRIEDTASLR